MWPLIVDASIFSKIVVVYCVFVFGNQGTFQDPLGQSVRDMLGIMVDNADNITLKMVGGSCGTIEGNKNQCRIRFLFIRH